MANLYFYYGAMGSSKTANALMTRYNYDSIHKKCLMVKPKLDTRDGERTIKSRIGLEYNYACFMDELSDLINKNSIGYLSSYKIDCIIVDEAQFLTKDDVWLLSEIVDEANIPVICYGLRADFQGNLFEGSKALFELADSIREIKTVCHCGKKAIMNARWIWRKTTDKNNNIIKFKEIVRYGDSIELGGDEKYVGLCRKCWKLGLID